MDFSKETIFTGARSHKKFDGKALSDEDMRAIYELTKLAPTANNSSKACIGALNARTAKRLRQVKLSKHTPKVYRNPLGIRDVSYKYICLKCCKQSGTIAALDTYPCTPMVPGTKARANRVKVN